MVSRPNATAAGTVPNTAARPRSAQIKIGRRRKRSAHAPAKRPNNRMAAALAPLRMPICSGEAFSSRAAVSGNPTRVIHDPICETAWPAHSFRKSGSRQRPRGGMSGLFELDYRVRAEPLVLAVSDGHWHARYARAERQRIVGEGVYRKPVHAIHELANGCESRKQILRWPAEHLRHRLPFQPHDREVLLIRPQHAVEKALPLEDLPRAHLQHPAVHAVDVLVAAEFRLVIPKLVFGHYERLDAANVLEVFVGHLEALQGEERHPDHPLCAFVLGRKDHVALLAILARLRAMRVQFREHHGLPEGVIVARGLCLALPMRYLARQVRRRLLRVRAGRHTPQC